MKNILIKILVFLSCMGSSICFAMDLEDYRDKTILVIIDMQRGFAAAEDPELLKTISQKISKAIEKRQRIFFVEYLLPSNKDYRTPWHAKKPYRIPTEESLTDLCRRASYPYTTIMKDSQDGSKNIIDKLIELEIKKSVKIKICGVNTSLCVLDTVLGLANGLEPSMKIVVLQDACGDINQSSHERSLETLKVSNSYADRPKIKVK